jgi:HrpA-like RNA helicase
VVLCPAFAQPLNYGPFKNGYYVGDNKKSSAEAQQVGMAEEQVAALSLVAAATGTAAAAASSTASEPPPAAAVPVSQKHASKRAAHAQQRAAAPSRTGEMSASQREESERLSAARDALEADKGHAQMRASRAKLPAHASRGAVLDALRTSQSLVICGETGCGKSTQVPQYMLEEAVERGTGALCTVLIAQPRRVAAVSLAERVAAERGEKVAPLNLNLTLTPRPFLPRPYLVTSNP